MHYSIILLQYNGRNNKYRNAASKNLYSTDKHVNKNMKLLCIRTIIIGSFLGRISFKIGSR